MRNDLHPIHNIYPDEVMADHQQVCYKGGLVELKKDGNYNLSVEFPSKYPIVIFEISTGKLTVMD